jgi:hypothetical protein
MAESNPTTDVETGTPTPEEVSAALNGVILGRSFPVTLPECPYCKKKNVMTVLDTHATSGTYIMCVFLGIISALILWWIPLVLDSVRFVVYECYLQWCTHFLVETLTSKTNSVLHFL